MSEWPPTERPEMGMLAVGMPSCRGAIASQLEVLLFLFLLLELRLSVRVAHACGGAGF